MTARNYAAPASPAPVSSASGASASGTPAPVTSASALPATAAAAPVSLVPSAGGRIPCAVEAGAIQIGASGLCLGLAFAWTAITGTPVGLVGLVGLQGAVAAAWTAARRLPWWWVPTQALFLPLAAWLHSADPPLWPFPLAFALLLGIYWSTFRTRVPLYLSGPAVWEALADQIPLRPGIRLIDIGSGLGGLLLDLERKRPDCKLHGMEIAPLTWAIARIRMAFAASRCRMVRGDYGALDLGEFDVVFAFLSPAAMPALWLQAGRQMRPGSRLISCEFGIPGATPTRTLPVRGQTRELYVWDF